MPAPAPFKIALRTHWRAMIVSHTLSEHEIVAEEQQRSLVKVNVGRQGDVAGAGAGPMHARQVAAEQGGDAVSGWGAITVSLPVEIW